MATELQIKMIKVLLYEPDKIKRLIASVDHKGRAYVLGFLYRLLNYRVGIEIDCAGGDTDLMDKYREYRYSATPSSRSPIAIQYDGNMGDGHYKARNGDYSESIELKVTFLKLGALKHLKKFLDDCAASEVILPASNGGLHVHIDLGHALRSSHSTDRGMTYFIKRRILKLRPLICKAFGVMPKREGDSFVAFGGMACVSIFRHHHTAEYRLGVPTFNYTKIMRYVLVCTLVNYSIRLRRQFDFDLAEAILQS